MKNVLRTRKMEMGKDLRALKMDYASICESRRATEALKKRLEKAKTTEVR